MLKQLFEYVRNLLFLAKDVQENRDDTDRLQERVEELTEKVCILANEIQRINEREQHEREKFMLRVENTLLRFERSLPAPRAPRKRK
ncbi:MAG: hypothetical protein ABI042_01760 [Verrucomicrobiota bacterium]